MTTQRRRLFSEPEAAKVPEITLMFWVAKLLTTAAGEAVSDYLGLGNLAPSGRRGPGASLPGST